MILLAAIIAIAVTATAARSYPEEPTAAAIAARVNGQSITVAEIGATIREALGLKQLPGRTERADLLVDLPAAIVSATLERAIDRRLVAERLQRDEKLRLTGAELAAIERRFAQSLTAHESSLDRFKTDRGWSDEDLTRYLELRTLWPRYLQRKLTDAALKGYFDAHRAEFDGTLVRVSHLLLRLPENAGAADLEKSLAAARAIRAEIAAGRLSFADAVRKHSKSPSRESGGDQGFLPRRGVMVESFSRAAFALGPGETSQPVVTPFGVHLIHCTEIKRGQGTWPDAREELFRALAEERFAELAKSARAGAKIEYVALPAAAAR